jgi:adhesin/invasin
VAFSLTLTVEDAFGNVVTGYSGTVHFSSSDNMATLPNNYTFTAADAGVHTFANALVLKKKGTQTLTVADTFDPTLTATVSLNVA